MKLSINNLYKSFCELSVFENFNIEFSQSKINCIIGPSGCGKTTLLNMISEIISPDRGEFAGFDKKTISYLFQEPRLLPWKTVKGNLDFALSEAYERTKREEIISKYIEMVDLGGFENYYPEKLSGGMKQRVSIARAFAYPSDILIMDEPFKDLDLKLKITLIDSFKKLWVQDNRTVIFVTHDIDEALYLGDKIFVFGKMPTGIKKEIPLDIPHNERSFKDSRSYQTNKEIYDLLMNES